MYLLSMIVLVVKEILKRHGIAALAALIVGSIAVGTIAHLSGGSFWLAAKYTAETLAAIGVVATILTLWSALTHWG